MKMIMALIEPQTLPEVRQALFDLDVSSMTISSAMGCSRDYVFTESYRGVDIDVNTFKQMRLEFAVADDRVTKVVDAISKHSRVENEKSRGAIYIYDLKDAITVTENWTIHEGPQQ